MSLRDELLAANEAYVAGFDAADAKKTARPSRSLAIVACMDARHTVEEVFGLGHGEAAVIRNAGPVVDEGTLRSLVVGVHVLGVDKVVVMGHSKCGMTGATAAAPDVAARIAAGRPGTAAPDVQRLADWLGGFDDVEAQVRRNVGILREHPHLPEDLEIVGLVYDNDTGRAVPVEAEA